MSEPTKSVTSFSLPTEELPRPTRLSIADLLLITLGTAIAIWILQPPQAPRDTPWTVVNVAMSPFYGCAVAAVIIAAFRLLTDAGQFATEPGHWLLLMIGTIFLGIGLLVRGSFIFTAVSEIAQASFAIFELLGALFLLVSVFVFIFAIATSDDETAYWRFVFRMIAWTVGLGFLGSLLFFSGGIELVIIFAPQILLAAAFVAAVVSDLWQRNYRDFWHWLGVAAFAGLPVHVVLLMIAALFGG